MDNKDAQQGNHMENPLEEYGLTINPNGTVSGPKRTKDYANTPDIELRMPVGRGLEQYRDYLEAVFVRGEKVSSELATFDALVECIFRSVTGRELKDFTHWRYLAQEDWRKYNEINRKFGWNNAEGTKRIDGINLGGLILINAENGNAVFPLMFHEIGHSLYLPKDVFSDELRAYFFQIVCTENLTHHLHALGISARYPEYSHDEFPSEHHRLAYLVAQELYQSLIAGISLDNESSYREGVSLRALSNLIYPTQEA